MDGIMNQPAAARAGAQPGADAKRAAARRIASRLADLRSRNGLVPVCSWCGKVRNGAGAWVPVESALLDGAGLALTHGVCPDCARDLLTGRHEAA
jgi:hypothetical protein